MPANLRGWVGKKKRMNKKTCLAKQGQHYETTVGEADHKFKKGGVLVQSNRHQQLYTPTVV